MRHQEAAFSTKAKGRRFGKNGNPDVFRYQVNRFLRNDLVPAFRSDSLTPSRVHDCVVNGG